mgnify:CR=1 FL=1
MVDLHRVGARIPSDRDPAAGKAARHVGIAWGLTGLLRAIPFHARWRHFVAGEPDLPARSDRFRAEVTAEPWVLGLHWATPLGPWQRFGTVELGPGAPFGDDERFDPLLNVPTGAENYGWTYRLREPSYTLARAPRRPLGRA